MAKKKGTEAEYDRAYANIAKGLREFGYPDVTPEMIKEIHLAWHEGKRDSDLPHGVIGIIVGKQIDEQSE